MQSRKPGAFVSRCLVIEGELVWTQCAMRGREWIESCMTGPDQVNIGATRRAVGAEAEGGVEGRVDADADADARPGSISGDDADVGWVMFYLRCELFVATAVHVARQAITGRRGLDLSSLEEGRKVQSQVNKASLAVPGVWVTLVCITTGGNREQRRSGQEMQAGRRIQKGRRAPVPGPRNNRVGSGRGRVESSRVKAGRRRGRAQAGKASKQA